MSCEAHGVYRLFGTRSSPGGRRIALRNDFDSLSRARRFASDYRSSADLERRILHAQDVLPVVGAGAADRSPSASRPAGKRRLLPS